MPLITQAKNLTRREVEKKLNLRRSKDPQFFYEWQNVELVLSDSDCHFLDGLSEDLQDMDSSSTHEEIVKMFALAPVLHLAGMSKDPFLPKAEHIIEIDLSYEDEDEEQVIIRGRIDILITHENLWAIVIETKRSSSNVLAALPQTLTYMMASKATSRKIYGLCTNGSEFVFVKLVKGEVNQYALSKPFPVYDPESNKLYDVVSILKHLGAIVLQGENEE